MRLCKVFLGTPLPFPLLFEPSSFYLHPVLGEGISFEFSLIFFSFSIFSMHSREMSSTKDESHSMSNFLGMQGSQGSSLDGWSSKSLAEARVFTPHGGH